MTFLDCTHFLLHAALGLRSGLGLGSVLELMLALGLVLHD